MTTHSSLPSACPTERASGVAGGGSAGSGGNASARPSGAGGGVRGSVARPTAHGLPPSSTVSSIVGPSGVSSGSVARTMTSRPS